MIAQYPLPQGVTRPGWPQIEQALGWWPATSRRDPLVLLIGADGLGLGVLSLLLAPAGWRCTVGAGAVVVWLLLWWACPGLLARHRVAVARRIVR